MASLIVRVDSIINIYDHFNVTPVPHVIRREANQLDLPTTDCDTWQFTQCYGTSDVLFDAKCDTDNAGELLEVPTKLRRSILTENKGNPAPKNSRTYTGWNNRLKTTRRR